jgi:hypothetical protein
VRLTRARRQTLGLETADDVVAWLERNWPAPCDTVEATFALWELGSNSNA